MGAASLRKRNMPCAKLPLMALPPLVIPARPKRPLVERAVSVAGIPKAFRPDPLIAEEMAAFYSQALDRQRGNYLLRRIKDDLLESADQGFFFKGVLYGNRGAGKSTEINRLLDEAAIKQK